MAEWWSYMHHGGVIEIEEGHVVLGAETGDLCLATYRDVNGLYYSGVQGIVIQTFPPPLAEYHCIPVSKADSIVIRMAEAGLNAMTNWLLISANDIQAKLNAQTIDIVSQVGSSGGGGGGFTSADRQLLNDIYYKGVEINANLLRFEYRAESMLSGLNTNITNMATNMILDHDDIIESLSSGLGVTEEGLLGGIGDLLAAGWEIVNGLFDSLDSIVTDLFSWYEGTIAAIEQSFALRMSEVADTINSGMAFISSEIFAAFNSIVDTILTPLNMLGDISDFLQLDFMDWLADLVDFDESKSEDIAISMLTTMSNIAKASKAFIPE